MTGRKFGLSPTSDTVGGEEGEKRVLRDPGPLTCMINLYKWDYRGKGKQERGKRNF